jgi:hypothetical protein
MPLTKPEEIDGEEAPEPPEPSDPKTDVTDEEVAVETDAVAGETLREALESQATLREQVGGDVLPSLARLKEENEELREAVERRDAVIEELAIVVEAMSDRLLDGKELDWETVDVQRVGNKYDATIRE